MNVLILGSGAREHALAWKLRQSARVDDLFVAPGNPGTAAVATNLALNPLDFAAVARTARERHAGLVVVGPEDPLAAGIADELLVQGIAVYGPTRGAARIEASKGFAKELMRETGIATAAAASFDAYERAAAYVNDLPEAPVIKADGLAAGKGVTVARDHAEALAALRAALVEGQFGEAGRRVVVEERLSGREVSAHVFTDGVTVLPMVYACDHKAVFDGGAGPNTGGMGAYSPPDFLTPALHAQILEEVVQPCVRALAARGHPYRGTLYPGLMLTAGGPRVVEFNCRFGDPETEVILPRLESDLMAPLWATVMNRLHEVELAWSDNASVAVVLASGGYPGAYRRGLPIEGLAELDSDILVFHAGTAHDARGRLVTAGGRVLSVVATGPTLAEARRKVYDNVGRIRFEGCHYRSDIGLTEPAGSPASR